MQGDGRVAEQGAQAWRVGDGAGQVGELGVDAGELGVDLVVGAAARGSAGQPVAVEVFGVVKAGDGLFGFYLGGEPGSRGAGVALEDGDLACLYWRAPATIPNGW